MKPGDISKCVHSILNDKFPVCIIMSEGNNESTYMNRCPDIRGDKIWGIPSKNMISYGYTQKWAEGWSGTE